MAFEKAGESEAYLLDSSTGDWYTLNETAVFLWERLEVPSTLADLVHAAVRVYDVPGDEAAEAFAVCLDELAAAGFVART